MLFLEFLELVEIQWDIHSVKPKWPELIQTGPVLKLPHTHSLYTVPVVAPGTEKPFLA